MFYFYSIVYLPFLVIAIAYIANSSYWGFHLKHLNMNVFFAVGGFILIAIISVSIYYYPLWTAIPLPKEDWLMRMWLKSWI